VSSAGARQEELAASLSAGDPPEPSSPAQAARGTTSPCVRRRVLVVDDDRDSAESLAMLLALLGHEVEQAYDGPAALAAVRRGAPDLVLLDLAMPGMSGYEVARRMRADNGSSKTVLIALTGYGADEDLRAAREAGFDGHLVKPIDFSALERILAGFPRR
jgi:CheY-like chemotaxis protein